MFGSCCITPRGLEWGQGHHTGLGCQVLDQQHLSFSKTLCILSSAPCREGSQSLPCSALGRSIPLLQKLQQHSKSTKQLWFRTAQARFQAILHLGSAAQATRLGACKIGPLAPGERGQSCAPSFGGLWKSTAPRLSQQALSCPALPGSEDLIHPKSCPQASPQLRKGQHSAARHQEHAAARKRPAVLRRSGTWTRAARPRLTPAGPATLPGRRSAGHLQRQGTRASLFTGILFTCCGPFFRCACRRVRDCLQRDSALSGL